MFPFEPNEYLDHYPQIYVSDFQNNNTSASSSSSSSPLSPNGFFNSAEFHHIQMHHQPPQYYHQQEVINHVPEAETRDLEKRVDDHDQSLKFTLWKNENDQSEIKWMSSKMRLMRKMKGSDHSNIKFEDQKQQQQQQASSSVINNASNYDNNNPPIRVCADCNTTKTPLWRSGPKGPKSLCNACGIRQRKARRALAAAAENSERVPEIVAPKIKMKNKEFKKRCRSPTGVVRAESSSDNAAAAQKKKNDNLEDFLFNLSKSLAFHRVFPQEETDAAILLMALSCSGVHG